MEPDICPHGVPYHTECDDCWAAHRAQVDSKFSKNDIAEPPQKPAPMMSHAEILSEVYWHAEAIVRLTRCVSTACRPEEIRCLIHDGICATHYPKRCPDDSADSAKGGDA